LAACDFSSERTITALSSEVSDLSLLLSGRIGYIIVCSILFVIVFLFLFFFVEFFFIVVGKFVFCCLRKLRVLILCITRFGGLDNGGASVWVGHLTRADYVRGRIGLIKKSSKFLGGAMISVSVKGLGLVGSFVSMSIVPEILSIGPIRTSLSVKRLGIASCFSISMVS
jgi:hypothetical protein